MNEEEIIKYIKDEIENDEDTASWFEEGHPTRKQIEEGIAAYQGLLDLYQKEKEKNKLLIEGKFREVADKNSYIKEMYISRDKIREEIKELESRINYKPLDNRYTYAELIRFAIEEMKCLMEEKHK